MSRVESRMTCVSAVKFILRKYKVIRGESRRRPVCRVPLKMRRAGKLASSYLFGLSGFLAVIANMKPPSQPSNEIAERSRTPSVEPLKPLGFDPALVINPVIPQEGKLLIQLSSKPYSVAEVTKPAAQETEPDDDIEVVYDWKTDGPLPIIPLEPR